MLTTKVQNRDTKLKKRRLAIHQGKPPTYKGRQKQKEKETMEKQNNEKAKDKMAVVNPYTSVITLNVNGLNSLTESYRVAGGIKKTRPIYMLSTRDPFQT